MVTTPIHGTCIASFISSYPRFLLPVARNSGSGWICGSGLGYRRFIVAVSRLRAIGTSVNTARKSAALSDGPQRVGIAQNVEGEAGSKHRPCGGVEQVVGIERCNVFGECG